MYGVSICTVNIINLVVDNIALTNVSLFLCSACTIVLLQRM